MIAWVAMTLAGSLGAYLRWQAALRLAPRGTLVVNLTGAFARRRAGRRRVSARPRC